MSSLVFTHHQHIQAAIPPANYFCSMNQNFHLENIVSLLQILRESQVGRVPGGRHDDQPLRRSS
jgi:hypothetical protein